MTKQTTVGVLDSRSLSSAAECVRNPQLSMIGRRIQSEGSNSVLLNQDKGFDYFHLILCTGVAWIMRRRNPGGSCEVAVEARGRTD